MTNGEKIIVILKPRKDQIRIYDNWIEIEIQKFGINFSCELNWWNAEYKESKEERINFAERIKLVNNAVEKTTAKWKQAIKDIKAELAKTFWCDDDAYIKTNDIIDKHTKELMQ